MSARRHQYQRSATMSSLVDNDVVRTCTSLIQRLTTRVRGPSMTSALTTSNPAVISSSAVAAAAISNMGSERTRLENKYADLLERRKQHPIITPATPDTSVSSGGLRHNGGRISNSRDRTPYRLNDYTKPAPAVAPGKYQYKTRPRPGGLQTSASTSAVYRPQSPMKTTASLYARPSPPPLDASKRRPYGGSVTSRQSLQVEPVSRNKLVLSNYEEHLNGLVRQPQLDISPRNRYDDFENTSRHYFASRAQDEVPKYRQRSEAARYPSSLATSKSCHNFGHGVKQHQYTSVNKAIATLNVCDIVCGSFAHLI